MGVDDRDWMPAPRSERPEPPRVPPGDGFWTQRHSFWQATWLVVVGCAAGMLVVILTGQLH
jgi:hypothetical protein